MSVRPDYLVNKIAHGADPSDINDIPDDAQPVEDALVSIEEGFPHVTRLPEEEGGLAPKMQDINGVWNLITGFTRWVQSGGKSLWNINEDVYQVGVELFDDDGYTYECIQINGADTATQKPSTSPTYWKSTGTILGTQTEINTGTDPRVLVTPLTLEGKISALISDKGIVATYQIFIDYPISAHSIGSDGVDYTALIANGPNNLPVVDPVGDSTGTWKDSNLIDNQITGLIGSNAADSDHDITISPGKTINSLNAEPLELTTAMTKQIDAVWAAGDNAGGLFSGSVAINTFYARFLIKKDSDGSIDWGWDISPIAANIPAGYTAFRRVGWDFTDSSANLEQFTDVEKAGGSVDREWENFFSDASSISPTIRTLVTVTAPINTIGVFSMRGASASTNFAWLRSTNFLDVVPSSTAFDLFYSGNGVISISVMVDGNNQIAVRSTTSGIYILTKGYTDRRVD